MTRLLSWAALLMSAIAAVLALQDDYESARSDGELAICRQMTEGYGRINAGWCEVQVEPDVWVKPRLEVRKTDK